MAIRQRIRIPAVRADQSSIAIGGISIGRELSAEVNIAAGNIIKNIQTIHQRALMAAEEATRARKLESKLLAQGLPRWYRIYLRRSMREPKAKIRIKDYCLTV